MLYMSYDITNVHNCKLILDGQYVCDVVSIVCMYEPIFFFFGNMYNREFKKL